MEGFKKMECGIWREGKKKEVEEEEWRKERGGWSHKKRKMKCGIWKRGRKRN